MQPEHVTVFRKPGVFAGWPANHGLWRHGDSILVGFETGDMDVAGGFHAIDRASPAVPMMAESCDGGETWDCWHPDGPLELRTHHGGISAMELDDIADSMKEVVEPIDFHNQHVKFRMLSLHRGPSYACVSRNGRRADGQWDGPFRLPMFGRLGMAARTSYLTFPGEPHRCLAFWAASKESDGREGQPCCVETTDGGKTWELLSWIDEPPFGGFGIMPSAVSFSDGTIICAVRWREKSGYGTKYGSNRTGDRFWSGIICYESQDGGRNWQLQSIPIRGLAKSGNPPDMVALEDGRIVLIYGWRNVPSGIVMQISNDRGVSWTDPEFIRQGDGCHDLGYSRSTVRTDGKIVTVYYWNDDPMGERYIAATIWEP